MDFWHNFLDSLDSNGGHILTLAFLIIIGAIAFRHGFPKAEDVVMGAFGALLQSMKDAGSNKERNDVSSSSSTTASTSSTDHK